MSIGRLRYWRARPHLFQGEPPRPPPDSMQYRRDAIHRYPGLPHQSFSSDQLARVHDVVGINGCLEPLHQAVGSAMLKWHVVLFADTDAVFT